MNYVSKQIAAMLICMCVGLITFVAHADVLRMRDDAPQEYVVKSGDTLWDISAMFLEDPWRWPELWQHNEEVANPHLIYPGDKLYLSWRDGRPVLTRKQTRQLTPSGDIVRKSQQPLTMFAHSMLEPFLTYHQLLTSEAAESAAQIIGNNTAAPRLSGHAPVFVEGEQLEARRYGIFTVVTELEQGVLVRHIADVKLESQQQGLWQGELSRLQREVRRGDLVLPLGAASYPLNYRTQSGVNGLSGQLVASLNSQLQQGKYDVVVLDQGRNQGVEVGQLYQAIRPGTELLMDYDRPLVKEDADDWQRLVAGTGRQLQLPDAATAEMMVVQTAADASFAIILRSHDWLRIGDRFIALSNETPDGD